MKPHCRLESGFTLIEIAMSIAVFAFGLTAVIVVYMVTLRWAEEVRIDLTALQSGRAALHDCSILRNYQGQPLLLDNRDAEAKGWLNNYYIVRNCFLSDGITLPDNYGLYVDVVVKVYYGGTDEDGRLVHQLHSQQIIPGEYAP